MIWDKVHECMRREDLIALQSERLRRVVKWVYDRVPFYRTRFDEAGVSPYDIGTVDDIRRLPFTTKDDIRDNYPYGLFAVPLSRVVRIHASSGTTGKPIVVGYTKKDLQVWSDLVARIAAQAGVTRRDVAQISFGYGLFTGGFGLHYGLEKLGATVVPASSGNTERQVALMKDFGTTVLISTPSYALYMAEVAEDTGIDPREIGVRVGMFGGEPCTDSMRYAIGERWGMKVTDNYGLTEVVGPGVAGECEAQRGLHISEDHFLVEVIDPESGEPLEWGEEGELVFTSLTKEAFPVIRYRTRDISRLNPEPCDCGRTTVRMEPVRQRSDDMLIIRGVNVFPSQIEAVLSGIDGISASHYQLVVDRRGHLDELEVLVELPEGLFTGRYKDLQMFEEEIARKIKNTLAINVKVRLVEPRSLERTTGKARRVIDRRVLVEPSRNE